MIKEHPLVFLTLAFIFGLGLVLALGCFLVSPEPSYRYTNFAIFILGVSIGWLAGAVMTPDNPAQASRFKALAGAAWGFISGYLIANIQKLIERLLDPAFYTDDPKLFRVICFAASVLLAMLAVYIFRQYYGPYIQSGSQATQSQAALAGDLPNSARDRPEAG